MSMVVFPFKTEDPGVAAANLATAARHERVERVLAVGASEDATFGRLTKATAAISSATRTPVDVILQDRIGDRRPGKGDGMNTGLRRFLEGGEKRIHFYDADIVNFDSTWIDGAERAADQGFPIVRHYFPRSSTDAMITWMVTRPGFALGHPASFLWRIRQPLGGEILLSRQVASELVADPVVAARSDWGIDTVITYATAAGGRPIYEHFVADGKQHALYGSLGEIRQMVVECFEAVRDVAALPTPPESRHMVEPEAPATAAVAHKVGYEVEATLRLLTSDWSTSEVTAASELPSDIAEPLLSNLVAPTFAFLDAAVWGRVLGLMLDRYRPEPGWRGVLFRLWVGRVLAYTTTDALAGHARAMEVLSQTVSDYATGRR